MNTGENNHIALTGTDMLCRLEMDNSSHLRAGHESLVKRWKMIQPTSGKRGKGETVIQQPQIGGNDDYDSENSWISG